MEPSSKPSQFSFSNLNKVTFLSKALALIIFITTPFIAGYVGFKLGQQSADSQIVYIDRVIPVESKPKDVPAKASVEATTTIPDVSLPEDAPPFVIKNTSKFTDSFPEQNVLINGKIIATQADCNIQAGNHIQESFLQAVSEVKGLSTFIPNVEQVVGSVDCWFAGGGEEMFMYKTKSTDSNVKVAGYETGECGDLPADQCSHYGVVKALY